MILLIKKYNGLEVTTKATFWFMLCNFILKGIGLITVPLFAYFLSPKEYGIATVFLSFEQIFLIFSTLELALGAYQRGIIRYKDNIKLYTTSLQCLWTITVIVVFAITCAFQEYFVSITKTNSAIMCAMFVYFLFQPAYSSWINLKRFNYDYKPAVAITLGYTIFTTGGTIVGIILIDQTGLVKIAGMLCLQIIFCAPFYIANINIRDVWRNRSVVKEYWKFSLLFQLPLVLHSLSYLVLGQADRIMISEMVGEAEAALYSVAYSLANVVIIAQMSINQVFKPWRYQKMEKQEYDIIKKNTNIQLVLIAIPILLFILVAPEAMKILFNVEYYDAVWTIPPITLSVFFMFLYSIFTDVESYLNKTLYIMYASVICAVINIILNYICIQIWGYIACGYTTLVSYIFFAVLHYYFMRKNCMYVLGGVPMFDMKWILVTSMVMIIITIIFTFLYPNIIVRGIIFIVIALIVGVKYKWIISQFKDGNA